MALKIAENTDYELKIGGDCTKSKWEAVSYIRFGIRGLAIFLRWRICSMYDLRLRICPKPNWVLQVRVVLQFILFRHPFQTEIEKKSHIRL